MGRRIKRFLYITKQKAAHEVLIPEINPETTTPRLNYHGIEPENIIGFDIDVYIPTGQRDKSGKFQMKYLHTKLFKRDGDH